MYSKKSPGCLKLYAILNVYTYLWWYPQKGLWPQYVKNCHLAFIASSVHKLWICEWPKHTHTHTFFIFCTHYKLIVSRWTSSQGLVLSKVYLTCLGFTPLSCRLSFSWNHLWTISPIVWVFLALKIKTRTHKTSNMGQKTLKIFHLVSDLT